MKMYCSRRKWFEGFINNSRLRLIFSKSKSIYIIIINFDFSSHSIISFCFHYFIFFRLFFNSFTHFSFGISFSCFFFFHFLCQNYFYFCSHSSIPAQPYKQLGRKRTSTYFSSFNLDSWFFMFFICPLVVLHQERKLLIYYYIFAAFAALAIAFIFNICFFCFFLPFFYVQSVQLNGKFKIKQVGQMMVSLYNVKTINEVELA